jgi:methionyl-tRNA formyltransferase
MRVIFMGTPDFSVGTLEAIIEAGHEVVLAVTQPDKPKGRGKAMQFTPVKECALAHGIEVFQPTKIRESSNVDYLRKFEPDIIIVVAFGQILTQDILDMPKYGCVNVHASLLPKYRGAAPIQWAVINGDEITGVTTMRMDAGIDTGDMIAKREIRIAADETGGSLFDRLADVGAKLCVETMEQLEKGMATFTPQDDAASTHVGMIRKEMGEIDWSRPAAEIERLIRGLNPWPSAYTQLDGKTFKVWRAEVVPDSQDSPDSQGTPDGSGYPDSQDSSGDPCSSVGQALPGAVIRAGKNELVVQTGDGVLSLREVQLAGKKRMDVGSFLRGYPVEPGTRL